MPAKPFKFFRNPRARVFLGTVGLLLWVLSQAQQFPLGQFKDFRLPEYHAPPNETRLKTLVEGAEALPQDGLRILIRKLTLQTFREDGTGEFIMRAEDCLYDLEKRQASSSGPLLLKTADGNIFTEGVGFLWRDKESTLTLSNRVHTVIYSNGSKPASP